MDLPPIPCRVEISKPLENIEGFLIITKYFIKIQSQNLISEGNSPSSRENSSHSWLHSLLCAVDKRQEERILFISYRHFISVKILFNNELDALQAFVEIQKWMNSCNFHGFLTR
jgi:hypothetical protein